MISIEKEVHINKPASDVFAFMVDFANNAKWQDGIIASEKTSDGPMGVGSTATITQKFMGKDMRNESSVTAFEPGKRFAAKTTSGPVQFEIDTTFEAMGDGTHLRVKMTAEGAGFFKVAEGLLKGELEKSFDRDFGKLKKILEA